MLRYFTLRKILLLSGIISICITGCTNKFVPIQGNYSNQFSQIVNSSLDITWQKMIDLCSEEGLSIKILDKPSGLIGFEKPGIKWTFENQEDSSLSLKDPTAWVVLEKRFQLGILSLPQNVTAEWTIRLKEINGRTNIFINLISVKDNGIYSTKNDRFVYENIKQAFSTKVFEKEFMKQLQ